MKKILIISLFVLGLIIPNIDVKAADVSNEEELRAAIEQGGYVTLTENVEVTKTLEINKDVTISSDHYSIMMQGDDTLMKVNSGNVTLRYINLYAGWNGKYDELGKQLVNVVKNQGTAVVVNGGTVNLDDRLSIFAGKAGLEVNGGTVTGSPWIYAGEHNYDNNTYSGGQGMIVNGGNIIFSDNWAIYSGGISLIVNNGTNIKISTNHGSTNINSYEKNGVEINDGSVVNIGDNPNYYIKISGKENGIEVNDGSTLNIQKVMNLTISGKNAIYLNGGTANLNNSLPYNSYPLILSNTSGGYSIYINKGINAKTGGDVLNLGQYFVLQTRFDSSAYSEGYYIKNPSIYVNPDIKGLKVSDEKKFLSYANNKLKLDYCSNNASASNTDKEDGPSICTKVGGHYDGPIYSNELGKCTTVYINGVKQNEPDASCNPVVDNENNEQNPQIVEVPSTSAYGSIIIIVLGIVCVIVSVFVMRRVTKKEN